MMNLNVLQKMIGGGFAIMALFAIMLLPYTPEAYAQELDVTCTNEILNEDVFGLVTVPADSWCQLDGISVAGDVRLLDGATLDIFESTIEGNLEGPETTDVYFALGSLVKGNVLINGVIYIEGDARNIVVEGEVLSKGSGLFRMWEGGISQGVTLEQKTVIDLFDNNFQKFVKISETNAESVSEIPQISVEKNTIEQNLEVILTSGNTHAIISNNIVVENILYKENAGITALLELNTVTKNLDVLNNNDAESLIVRDNKVTENMNVLVNLLVSVFDNDIVKALLIKDNTACLQSDNIVPLPESIVIEKCPSPP